MRPTLTYVKEKFDYYNQLCFDGLLPTPPIKLNTRNIALGLTKSKLKITPDGAYHYSDISIEISVRKDLPEEEYIDTIVHEMIHYYICINNLKDTSPHGQLFMSMMNEIIQKHGIKITVTFTPTEEQLIQTITRPRYVCVVDFNDSKTGLAVVAKNKLFEMWNAMDSFEGAKGVKWYVSNRAIFGEFHVAVSPRVYYVDSNKIHHYLTGAKELENTGSCIRIKQE